MQQQVNVRTYQRKGKLVKSYQRKQDKKNKGLRIAGSAAGILGISLVSYLVMRKRYVTNMIDAGKKLSENNKLGQVVKDNTQSLTFTIGGTGDLGKASTMKQSESIVTALKKSLNPSVRKNQQFIPLNHKLEVGSPPIKTKNDAVNGAYYIPAMLSNLSLPFFKGKNTESIRLAEEIYNWHLKNPTIPVNIVGYSAGGNMAKDIELMLRQKKVDVNVVTIGSSDFKLIKSQKGLNIMGNKDNFNFLKHPKSKIISNVNSHSLSEYLVEKDNKTIRKDVTNEINRYLFN